MDKMKFETVDGVDRNVDKIAAMFPQVVTEIKGEDGKITRAVKWDVLKELLSGEYVEGGECYDFTWPGKRAAIAEAAKPIRKTLRPCKEESKDWDTTQNLYIEGDNLEVLKLLQESYLGKVKMIYIDPPYNTGNDFIYEDDFKMSRKQWENESESTCEDEETGEKVRMVRNTESNGRFHSDWCSMIYSRLVLARDLLSEDGIIFISIDDTEVDNLKKICSDIFGEDNLVGIGAWRRVEGKPGKSKYMGKTSEFVMIFTKDKAFFQIGLLPYSEAGLKEYRYSDSKGRFRRGQIFYPNRGVHSFSVVTPYGNTITGDFTKSEDDFKALDAANMIYWAENGDHTPYLKVYLDEDSGMVPTNTFGKEFGSSQSAVKEFKDIFDSDVVYFDNPKPTKLLQKLLLIANLSADSIILDFFSGSATTAHAVMQLNAENGGKRKFIMVQLPEVCAPDSEAAKAGYQNICEIGKERIRRAGEKIKEEAGLSAVNLDVGFRVFKVADSNMKDVYYSAAEYSQGMLSELVDNIKEDRTDLDLLYGCLLEWGVELSLPHTSEKIDGVTVHTVNDGDLIACFDRNIPESAIRKIAKRHPLRVVFRDNSFSGAPQKINVEEIFKLLSPTTTIKVI